MGDAEGQGCLAEPIFFLDENYCGNLRLHAVFAAARVEWVSHLTYFERGTADTVWIPAVAEREWVLLTADASIRRNLLEREAVRRHELRMFYFSRNDLSGAELGTALTTALPAMLALCRREQPPFAASITRRGDVHLRDRFQDEERPRGGG